MNTINISKIKIEGFRGFNEPQIFDFNHRTILLYGPNGVGKSSLLDTIEFALFGEVVHFYGREFSRTRDELVNIFNEKKTTKVDLILSDSQRNVYRIHREKRMGRKKTKLTLEINNERYNGEEAQRRIEDILKITLTSFYNSVYLHQALLRQLIIGGPSERAEALDSLLGLYDLRILVDSLPIAHVTRSVNEIKTYIEKVEREKIGASKVLRNELNKLRKAIEERVKVEMSTKSAVLFLKELVYKLDNFCKENEIPRREVELPELSIESVKGSFKEIKEYYQYLLKTPKLKLKELEEHKEILSQFIGRFVSYEKEVGSVEREIKRLLEQHGEKAFIEKRLKEIKHKLQNLEELHKKLDLQYTLLNSGLSLLEESNGDRCPLCKTGIEKKKLAERIKDELSSLKRENISRVEEQISSLEEKKSKLDSIFNKIMELEKHLALIRQELVTSYKKIFKELYIINEKRRFSEILIEVSEKLQEERDRILTLSGKMEKETDEKLSTLGKNIDTLELLINYLEKEQQLNDLQTIIPSAYRERKILEGELRALRTYEEAVLTLSDVLTSVRIRAAKELLDRFGPNINMIYARLQPHAYYRNLIVDLEKGRGKHEYWYMIKAINPESGQATYVKSRFSQAQMNLAALSIFLTLVLGSSHNFRVIILDEPEQSLDSEHKENLINALRDLQIHNQLIISTQNQEFQKLLNDNLVPPEGKSRLIYNFREWRKEGPLIEVIEGKPYTTVPSI